MLEHQPSQTTDSTPSWHRVTPDEFAQASAAVEQRQADRKRDEEKTIALQEALDQLELNLDAEELMAEVHALRSAKVRQSRLSESRKWKQWAAILAISLLTASVGILGWQNIALRSALAKAPLHHSVIATTDNGVPAVSAGSFTLSTMPQDAHRDVMGYADSYALKVYAAGAPLDQVVVSTLPVLSEKDLWQIRTRQGRFLIGVFGNARDLEAASQGLPATIYPISSDGQSGRLIYLEAFRNARFIAVNGKLAVKINAEN